ncbi:MAG: protein kinase [Planctomycetota bacterium]
MTAPGFDDPLLSDTPVVDGYRVLGPCVLYTKIGQGGMGAVFRGRHVNLDIDVAVKCLKKSLASEDEAFVLRFQREARLAAGLNDANLIRVFDVDQQHGLHFLVMEFVEGESLRERVRRKGALAAEEAALIIRNASQGLAVAHAREIVHRDIKPDNILVSRRGEVKVADLGLAKALEAKEGVTATNMVLGTPQYMPPEQWEGTHSVGLPGDVYALGATLFYLLAGRDPIEGGSLTEVLRRVCFEPFPEVAQAVPGIDAGLAEIVRRATAKDQAARYPTAAELRDALDGWLRGRGALPRLDDAGAGQGSERMTVVSPPPSPTLTRARTASRAVDPADVRPTVQTPAPSVVPETAPRPRPAPEPRRGGVSARTLAILAGAAFALLVLGGIGLWALLGDGDEPPRKSPRTGGASSSVAGNGGEKPAPDPKRSPDPKRDPEPRRDPDPKTDPKTDPEPKRDPVPTPSPDPKRDPEPDPPKPVPAASSPVGVWVLDREKLRDRLVELNVNSADAPRDADERDALREEMAMRADSFDITLTLNENGRFEGEAEHPGGTGRAVGSWRLEGDTLTLTTEFEDGVRKVIPESEDFSWDGKSFTGRKDEGKLFTFMRREEAERLDAEASRRGPKLVGRWQLDKMRTARQTVEKQRRQLIAQGFGDVPDLAELRRAIRAEFEGMTFTLEVRAATWELTASGSGLDAEELAEAGASGTWRRTGRRLIFTVTREEGERLDSSEQRRILVRLEEGRLLATDEDHVLVFRREG